MIPHTKCGVTKPKIDSSVATWSIHVLCLTADTIPSGMPTPKASTIVMRPRCSVTGHVRPITPATDSSGCWKDMPKSSFTAPPSQSRYCCQTGLSSP